MLSEVLTVVERYNQALELLDAYDHQNMERPKGNKPTYILTYEECRKVIDNMKFGDSSSLFGNEKDDSFKGASGQFIKVLREKICIPLWRKRQQIYCILSQRITVFLMEIRELQ